MKRILFAIAQVVWGFPQTLAGLAVFLAYAGCPRFLYHGAIVTEWGTKKGLSLGLFLFMPTGFGRYEDESSVASRLLVHEYGHSIQSLVLGPLYLIVIGLPSVIWSNVPSFERMRQVEGKSYYTFFTERSANWLGERVLKRAAID